jgi:hypothetical protein
MKLPHFYLIIGLLCTVAGCGSWLPQTRSTSEKLPLVEFVEEPEPNSESASSIPSTILSNFLPDQQDKPATPPISEVKTLLESNSSDEIVRGLAALTAHLEEYGEDAAREGTLLVSHPSPQVRLAALKLMAEIGGDQEVVFLIRSTHDTDFSTKRFAIQSLAVAKPASSTLAQKIDSRLDEIYREGTAVFYEEATAALLKRKGLAFAGTALIDDRWRVRRQIGLFLQTLPCDENTSPEMILIAQALMDDANPQVQLAAVEAVETWPIQVSGPLFIAALHSPVFKTRTTALKMLTEELLKADERIELIDKSHEEIARTLESRWEQHVENASDSRESVASSEVADPDIVQAATATTLAAFRRGEISQLELETALSELGRDRLSILLTLSAQQPLPEEVYVDVLAKGDESFQLLAELTTTTKTAEQNRLIAKLQQRHDQSPLPPLALVRLAELSARQQDPFVLLRVLKLMESSEQTACRNLAIMSLSHSDAQVRTAAANYFWNWPHADAAVTLFELAQADNVGASSAARALSRLSTEQALPIAQKTTSLLSHPDVAVQRHAAIALAAWDNAAGWAAIERLAESSEESELLKLAAELAYLPKQQTLNVLVHLFEQSTSVRVAALRSLNTLAEQLTDSPDIQSAVPSKKQLEGLDREEQMSVWRTWLERS